MDKKRYYLDDFVLEVAFGADALPDCDFQGEVASDGGGMRVKFGRVSGEAYGYRAGEQANVIEVACDHHGMMPGRLGIRVRYDLPDVSLPDGMRRIVREYGTDVRLTSEMSAGCVPGRIEVTLSAPFALVRDTDVYAEVLDRVNGVLAGLLDGSGEAGKPKKKASNFRISQWLTPGMMRNTARPGMVYDASTGANGIDFASPWSVSETCVMLLNTSKKEGTIALSKLFPGGKFGETDIIVAPRIHGCTNLQWDYYPSLGEVSYQWDKMGPGVSNKFALMVLFRRQNTYTTQMYIDEGGRLRDNHEPVCFRPAPEWAGLIGFIKPTDEDEAAYAAKHHDAESYRPHRMVRLHCPDGRRVEVKYLHSKGSQGQANPKKSCYWQHPHGWSFTGKHFLRVRVVTKRGLRTPWHICQKVGPGNRQNTFFKVVQ